MKNNINNKFKKLILLIIFLLVLTYSIIASPSDPVAFGNSTTDTCFIGGSAGMVNCTGNFTLNLGSLHFNDPLVNGSIRFLQFNNVVNVDRFENGIWISKDTLGGSFTTDKVFLKNIMPEILLLESDNTTKNNIIRRDTSSQGIEVGNYNGEIFLSTSDRVLVRKKAAEVDAVVFALENVTLENVMNVTFNFTTADFEGIPFDGAINFNLTFKFDRNYTGRFHIKIFDIDFSLTLPIYETSSFFDFQQGFCCDAVLVSQNKSALVFNPPLILLSNIKLFNILSFSELVNITGGNYSNESDQFIPFIGAGGILQQTSEVLDETNFNSFDDISGQNLTLDSIGSSTFKSLQDMQNVFHSVGWITDGNISDNGNLSVNVSAGTGLIRATDNTTQTILFFDWSASTNIIIPLDKTRYIGVEYNSGSPQVVVKTTDTWDYQTDFPLGVVIRDDNLLHITFNPQAVGNHASMMVQRAYGTMPLQRDVREGGLILDETGTREITVTKGVLWDRLNKFIILAFDSSGSNKFDRYYSNGSGGFFAERNQTQWNNTLYDDGSGTLATLGNNRYSVQWFYIETDGDLISIYGRNQYVMLAQAELDVAPSPIPDRIALHSRLIGRIIFQKSSSSAEAVQSAFSTVFPPTLVVDHGNLAGLSDDDHTQYFLADGSRIITGNLNSTNTVNFPSLGSVVDDRSVCAIASTGELELKNGACSTSSRQFKSNIREFSVSGLDLVMRLIPKYFNYKDYDILENDLDYLYGRTKRRIGLIAEEVYEIIPEIVLLNEDIIDSIDYPKLSVINVKAIQELNSKILYLEERIKALESGIKLELTPKYSCISKLSEECPFGLSGGKHTRCYKTAEKHYGVYIICNEGWVLI